MRRVLVLVTTVATAGALIFLFGANDRSGGPSRTAAVPYPPPTQTSASQGQVTYPGPHTPNPVYPTIVVGEPPTPIHGTPTGGFPTEAPFVTPTRAIPQPTATFPALPTVLPTAVDPNRPTPTDYPPQVPRTGSEVISSSSGSSVAEDVDSMTYVIRGRVARIDPPFWSTIDGKRPSIIESSDITSPALLNVEEVYKGPSVSSLEVGIGGYCFTPTDCTLRPFQFTWDDVVGYDLILFIIVQPQAAGRPIVPTHAYPFATYVVHPSAARDELLFVHGSGRITLRRSALEASIRAAPSANRR